MAVRPAITMVLRVEILYLTPQLQTLLPGALLLMVAVEDVAILTVVLEVLAAVELMIKPPALA
jgi:hypothetical protein